MQLPFRITVCGLEELPTHCAAGVSHVLSVVNPDCPEPAAFAAFGEHVRRELRFHDIIDETAGMQLPTPADVAQLLAFGRFLPAGACAHLLVHCHAGVSRSSAAMAVLLAQASPETAGAEIFAELLRVRPIIWPNLRIVELGDAALGRGGDLVGGVRPVYRHQLDRRPELRELYRNNGRAREIAMAAGTAAPG